MMAMPSCEFGDFSGAERAESTLLFPEVNQMPFSSEVMNGFHIETFFKIRLPFGIIRICFALDFCMPFNSDTFCLKQSDGLECPFLPKDFTMEDPVLPFDRGKVFLPYPSDGFLGMSPFCPLPQSTKDCVVYFGKGFLADHMQQITS